MAVTINEGTQTEILTVTNAGTDVQVVKLDVGSGTALQDFGGTVTQVDNIAAGTITSVEALPDPLGSVTMTVGTLSSIPDLPGGTVDLITNLNSGSVRMTVGTLAQGSLTNVGAIHTAGTISSLPDLPGGTVDEVSSVANIVGGTIGSVLGIGGTVSVSGASSGTVVEVNKGTINLGSSVITSLPDPVGSVVVTAGTSNVTAFSADIPGGTTDLITRVGNIGTIESGTVTTNMGDLTGGTIDLLTAGTVSVNSLPDPLGSVVVTVGTVSNTGTNVNVATGTQQTLGTVGNLNNGSVRVTVGTISSLPDPVGSVVVTAGTTNVTAFGADIPGGTVDSITNVAAGTFQSNPTPTLTVVNQGTLGTAGAAAWGTLSAASGAGTNHYVAGLSLVVTAGTVDAAISFGTTASNPLGTGVLARGNFAAGAGMARDFNPPIDGGANSEITYWLGGAGSVYYVVNYWKA